MKTLFAILLAGLFAASAWAADAVNVNKASAEEIAQALKGVGLNKAELIVAYRQAHGAFRHIDELINVKGIGLRTIDMNRDSILLEDANPLAARER